MSNKLCDTEAKRNSATHSSLSVEINEKVDRLEVLRDTLTLIRYMIDTVRKTDVYEKVRKSWKETKPVTVSDIR